MSKQSAEEALPLITLQNGKFVLGEQAAHMISSIKGEIGVIGVAGLYRYVYVAIQRIKRNNEKNY